MIPLLLSDIGEWPPLVKKDNNYSPVGRESLEERLYHC